ncbi:hypothetical protein AN958_00897, partial [Leucoagaricus sp. SymC.cos]
YPMMLKKEEELNTFINKNLKSERIYISKSQYMTLYFFIPKKDSLKQLVQDYWKINQYTVKDKTPIPLISKVISTQEY